MSSSLIKMSFMTICLAYSFISTTAFAKEYYKWVDAEGSTHYTANPPPKSAHKKGKIATFGSNNHTQHDKNPATEKAEENHASTEVSNQLNTEQAAANTAKVVEQKKTPAAQTPAAKE